MADVDPDLPDIEAEGMMSVPDVVGAVYGVRQWHVDGGADGAERLANWWPGRNVARCGQGLAHTPPDVHCGCGYYAYHDSARISRNGSYGPVTGLVKGWGRIAVAEDGWRAQYAEVVAIASTSRYADSIAALYGVPTMTLGELDLIAVANGVAPELRPGKRRSTLPEVRPVIPAARGVLAPTGVLQPTTRAKYEIAEILVAAWVLIALLLVIFL